MPFSKHLIDISHSIVEVLDDHHLFKAIFHSTILDIPMRPLREDQKHQHRFTR